MASIESIVTILDMVNDKLDEAVQQAQAADTEADEAVSQALAINAATYAQGMTIARDEIEKLINQVMGAKDACDQAITAVRSADPG